jgi:hypothetical protein
MDNYSYPYQNIPQSHLVVNPLKRLHPSRHNVFRSNFEANSGPGYVSDALFSLYGTPNPALELPALFPTLPCHAHI